MTPDLQTQESGFCSQCGEANARTAAFCAKCGAPLPWAAPKLAPATAPPVPPLPTMPPPPPSMAAAPQGTAPRPPAVTPPPAPPQNNAPLRQPAPTVSPAPTVAAGVRVPAGLQRLGAWLLPPHLLTAYRGATPQELLRLYGPRVVGLVLVLAFVIHFAYGIVSALAVGALACMLVGILNPDAFRFAFGEKTSKSTVGWTFGVLALMLGALGSSLEPRPVESPTAALTSDSTVAPVPPDAPVERSPTQKRAEAAKARAAQDQARAQSRALQAQAEKVAQSKRAERDAIAVSQAKAQQRRLAESETAPAPKPAPAKDALPSNVEVVEFKGVGKRQVGVVDKVGYAVVSVERVASIGSTRADGVFYLLHVVASNIGKKTRNVTTARMKMLDDQEREFSTSAEGNTALLLSGDPSAKFLSAQMQPGVAKQFTLVFDAPEDAAGLKLKIPAGTFSFSSDAVIKLPGADE